MKTPLLFLALSAICFVSKAQDSIAYEIEFSDGYKELVTFDYSSIDTCYRNYLSFDLINLGLALGNQDPAFLGTIGTNIDYHYYPADNNKYYYGNLYIPFLDGARMDPNVNEMNVWRIYLDGGYSKAFSSQTELKERKLNFQNPERQVEGYDYTVHQAKLPVYYQAKWMYRTGIGLHQRGIYAVSDNSAIYEDSLSYIAGGERSLILQGGISKSSYYKLNYKSQGFGSQNASIINHLYLDLLFAPLVLISGESYTNGKFSSAGALDQFKELQRNYIGWRFGLKYWGSATRSKMFGSTGGLEFGLIPGLANGGGYILFKYGMIIFWD